MVTAILNEAQDAYDYYDHKPGDEPSRASRLTMRDGVMAVIENTVTLRVKDAAGTEVAITLLPGVARALSGSLAIFFGPDVKTDTASGQPPAGS